MSPEYLDPPARTPRRRSAAPPAPRAPAPLGLADPAPGRPAEVLPAILDPFARDAAPAVMTRIALDWILDEPVLDRIFDEAAEGQYTRDGPLPHSAGARPAAAGASPPPPRPASRRRQPEGVASTSGFYRKLTRMERGTAAAVARHTAQRARALIEAAGALRPEPIEGYAG